MDDVFTTGQIGKICRVDPRTVQKWIDRGDLKGFRIPGRRPDIPSDRLVPRESLIKFLKEHGMPLGGLRRSVLVVSRDDTLTVRLTAGLSKLEVDVALDAFAVGILLRQHRPVAGVIDDTIGRQAAMALCRRLTQDYTFPLVLVTTQALDLGAVSARVEVFSRPFDAELLATRLLTLAIPP